MKVRAPADPDGQQLQQFSFLAEGGELGAMMRAFEWAQTPLGPPGRWPQSLKTAVRILLTSQQPMFVWWGDELINLYNDPYRSILGGKHPKALGQPASVVWKEIWDQVGPRAQSTISRDQGTYDEALFLMMERNGYPEETYYTFSYSPIPNDEGITSGIFCANTDDTQRIIGPRRLATQRELATRTMEVRNIREACANCAAALAGNPYDLPFTLLYLKQQGDNRATLMGQSGIAGDHPAAAQQLAPDSPLQWPVEQVLRAAEPQVIELPGGMAFPPGPWGHAPTRAALLPINPSGQLGHAAVLISGLSPHRPYDDAYQSFLALIAGQVASALASAQAYEDERKRAEALAELDRAKTTFFSNVSHEFRTPLTLMLGPVEDLLRGQDPAAPSPERQALELVHRNGLRLQKLVNALLDFSRIEAGRMLARFEPTDLAAYTADLASTFRSAMERAKLTFTVDCQRLSLPVYVDHEMWEKIVLNLLSNALKYTFEGSVAIRLREEAGWVELSVSDTGTGIPETELPRLFERFHRVEGARARTYEGTGIGLALVQELTRLQGGRVSVASTIGRGSIFTVCIPFGNARALPGQPGTGDSGSAPGSFQASAYVEEALGWLPRDDAEPSVDQRQTTFVSSPPTQGRILLADDNADMREYVQRLLKADYEVMVASNGKQAMAAAVERLPDLVLSDVMMPELDGFGLLSELRANPLTRAIPVVFLSARAGEEASAEGREAGADDYIVKPFTARELLARLRGTLMIHRERRRSAEQLFQIFAQAPVAICVLRTPDFVFELANPFYEQVVRGRQIIGRKLAEVIPDLPEEVWSAFRKVAETGEPVLVDERHTVFDADADGRPEEHWLNAVYHPLRNPDQSIGGVIAVVHDVTQQVQTRKEVERVNRELEEFAYVASHDLQEPLRMVNTYSQLLVRRFGKVSAEQTQIYVDFISSGVRRMEELIHDLLSFARTVQSDAPVLEAVPLRVALDRALEVLQPQIEEKKAILQIGELPVVMGDETQLPQLFQNLLSNALKYSKADVAPRIVISSIRNGSEWVIAVQDNGIGFEQQFAGHIFGLFKRLHRSEYPGTGLGLAICKRIVERYGGRIWAESEPGAGSTFFFSLAEAN